METLLEYKCPNCGGALSFDSGTQRMVCPYCDTEFDVEALREQDEVLKNPPQSDMSWQIGGGEQWQTEDLRSWVCNSCGGEILGDHATAATACPYCGNPVVMAGSFAGDLKPDLVIPFKLDKEAAMAAMKKHFKGKPLLPKLFSSQAKLESIQGVYAPFWLFDADASGEVRYKATRVRHWSDSRWEYTETSHYSIYRAGSLGFEAIPVDGSARLADTLMESIEPFDLSQAVDFQTAYLAGYLADRYDVTAENSRFRANERIEASTRDAFADTVMGYSTVTPVTEAIRLDKSRVRYALYPVWLLNAKYKGKTYLFAMNGQTGKFVGDLPISKGRALAWWAGLTAVFTLIAQLVGSLLR